MDLLAERLTQEAFAPYGDVIAVAVRRGRKYYSSGLGNACAGVRRVPRW
jgi:ureidoglycolate hydrolase